MTYLLDTCILVDYLRAKDGAVRFLEGLQSPPAVSVVTVMELTAGVRGAKEERQIARLFSALTLLDVDRTLAEAAGKYLRQYAASHSLDPPDALIAATAKHHELALATLNLKYFPMFTGLKRPYAP